MLNRIVCNPEILGGKPCVRGTRISVEFLLELAASGATPEYIVRNYPELSREDVEAAFRYAAKFLRNDSLFEVELPH